MSMNGVKTDIITMVVNLKLIRKAHCTARSVCSAVVAGNVTNGSVVLLVGGGKTLSVVTLISDSALHFPNKTVLKNKDSLFL